MSSSLRIEHRALLLAEQDLTRKRTLLAREDISEAQVDEAEAAMLAVRQRVQELENQLKLIPAERRVLEANTKVLEAQLAEAKLDLERTTIRLPFEARLAEVHVEVGEYVKVGQLLVVADAIDVAEVNAQFAIAQARPLFRGYEDFSLLTVQELTKLVGQLGFTAEVRLRMGHHVATWPARFERFAESIDPQTRTVGFIVAVDEPYRRTIPGKRPPLTKNMYVEVELRGHSRPDQIIIPRVAVHAGPAGNTMVYLADDKDRLRRQPVTLGPRQTNFVVVEEGLTGGERLVVSDLVPAIEGMRLAPTVDTALAEQLLAEAAGEVAVR